MQGNAGHGCSNTELKIVGTSNNLVYLINFSDYNTRLHAALSLITKIFVVLLLKVGSH